MAGLVLKNIKKEYEKGFEVVKDFNLEVQDKEFIVFVGPSGCGKSTTLRMIAGLEEITEGELYIDNKLMNNVSPKDRDIAMVFQNYALYPHMTVYENMAFALKLRKTSKKEIDAKVLEAAKILNIEDILDRKPKALSGGQRQRVAMGRAIVRHPKVFLMDEPLSNLDAKLRVQMRTEIAKLYRDLETTFIYVTHDQTEAMTLGTRIVVMKDGIIQQIASPKGIYEHPVNLFVARFIGSPQINTFDGKTYEKDGKVFLRMLGKELQLPKDKAEIIRNNKYQNTEVIVGIRSEHISYKDDDINKDGTIVFESEIDISENLGSETYVYLKVEEKTMIVKTATKDNINTMGTLKYRIDLNNIHIFNKDTEKAIL
ncbi:sn-glycerol-3-phosphate ABC transporter ATP-binding protein UgpC [Paraclostridium ghonii]|uniref:Multiple sugar transport system ATP-binding protein n=1 Tax=Paraclostridium ghonii TaxID=29358 RepID=A0ABU0MZI9_9FIRM|nr:sn-glycerol-3-phosphate ABC transporter ATP-binding protein UgpC [Paeniclostridium ghonii]MDQ0556333.1 multiple sugar transport system ATP-binding protein [Paeniclostridium ghonii]